MALRENDSGAPGNVDCFLTRIVGRQYSAGMTNPAHHCPLGHRACYSESCAEEASIRAAARLAPPALHYCYACHGWADDVCPTCGAALPGERPTTESVELLCVSEGHGGPARYRVRVGTRVYRSRGEGEALFGEAEWFARQLSVTTLARAVDVAGFEVAS